MTLSFFNILRIRSFDAEIVVFRFVVVVVVADAVFAAITDAEDFPFDFVRGIVIVVLIGVADVVVVLVAVVDAGGFTFDVFKTFSFFARTLFEDAVAVALVASTKSIDD